MYLRRCGQQQQKRRYAGVRDAAGCAEVSRHGVVAGWPHSLELVALWWQSITTATRDAGWIEVIRRPTEHHNNMASLESEGEDAPKEDDSHITDQQMHAVPHGRLTNELVIPEKC
ncbi:uncharacterized protein PAC_03980 [Phialocephala subalpina]|uniref:Uncharacterized protein n=1 Tax=Phialocephala subalpina TaxID=576137 RepID=A0A1L7WMT4_9HELO|nr:uncharacterized protein PAC_03980 [Phialocephala subalpina]